MGAEKWLDIELWDSTKECFDALKLRGYRIATTHVRIDAVKNLMTITSCGDYKLNSYKHVNIIFSGLWLFSL